MKIYHSIFSLFSKKKNRNKHDVMFIVSKCRWCWIQKCS